MNDKSSDDGSFKVEDKRRLDSEGNTRDAAREYEERAAGDSSTDKGQSQEWPPVSFTSFVLSLGTQTLMQLGELPPPPGVKVEIDLHAARQTIDLLMMLEEKTKGNLDAKEQELLEGMLNDAQMSYVRVSSKRKPSTA